MPPPRFILSIILLSLRRPRGVVRFVLRTALYITAGFGWSGSGNVVPVTHRPVLVIFHSIAIRTPTSRYRPFSLLWSVGRRWTHPPAAAEMSRTAQTAVFDKPREAWAFVIGRNFAGTLLSPVALLAHKARLLFEECPGCDR